jgi:ankyrin repeat protein
VVWFKHLIDHKPQKSKFFRYLKMANIVDLPPEIRVKIYKRCDVKSLINFGEVYPRFMSEIIKFSGVNKKPLWFEAVREDGHASWVKAFINTGFNINTKDGYGWTALHVVRNPAIAKILIEAGANPNLKNSYGSTPLQYAVGTDNLNLLKMIVGTKSKPQLDLNARNSFDYTALHLAAGRTDPTYAKILIEAGASPCLKNKDGETPLDWAKRCHHTKTFNYLKKFSMLKTSPNLKFYPL